MIIVEGPDNSGKTTLISQLAKDLNRVTIKGIRPQTFWEIKTWCQVIEKFPWPVILDRFPLISEPVYGPIIRGVSLITREEALIELKLLNPIIIYCRPSLSIIKDFQLPQMAGVPNHIDKIVNAYDDWMVQIGRQNTMMVYNYEAHLYHQTLKEIKNELQRRTRIPHEVQSASG